MSACPKILIVIVLYKQSLDDCQSFNVLKKIKNKQIALFVYDNSPSRGNVIHFPESLQIMYMHNPSNPGVSKAYNEGSSYAKKNGFDYLLLLDQDTELPENFIYELEKINSAVTTYPLVSFRLMRAGEQLSPFNYRFKRGSMMVNQSESGVHPLKNISLLNSGILISVELFDKAGGYDENVELYFSDFVFLNRVRRIQKDFYISPIVFKHSMSSDDTSNLESFMQRFKFYLIGARQASVSENCYSIYAITTFLRVIKVAIKIKSLVPLRQFLHYFL